MRDLEHELRSELGHIHSLLANESFKWYLQKMLELREKAAKLALRRVHAPGDHEFLVGRINAYDDGIGLLEHEAKRITNDMQKHGIE